jgi:hypothetical protein
MLEGCINRRNFVKSATLAGLGASLMGANPSAAEALTLSTNDMDILNLLLNVEYLLAEQYFRAYTGNYLENVGYPVGGVGPQGPTTGGLGSSLAGANAEQPADSDDPNYKSIVGEISGTEIHHYQSLRAILGSQAVAKPAINLNATADQTTGGQQQDFRLFLPVSRAISDVAVSAYNWALTMLQNTTALATAERIAIVNSQFAANIRLLVALNGVSSPAVDSQDAPPPPSGTHYFSVNGSALGVVRTPSQVLAFLYQNATPGTASGGFFPNGVNGFIRAV